MGFSLQDQKDKKICDFKILSIINHHNNVIESRILWCVVVDTMLYQDNVNRIIMIIVVVILIGYNQ